MKKPNLLYLLGISICLILLPLGVMAQLEEELIVFTQNNDSDFTKNILDSLQKYTKAQNIPIKIVELEDQVVEEIPYTPFIVYQNHLGRSPYKGRFTSFSRIKNAVRMLRRQAKGFKEKQFEEKFVWEKGQTKVLFYMEMTEIKGEGAKYIKQLDKFKKQAVEGVKKGLKDLEWRDKGAVSAATYNFYLNFHPYIGADKKLYVSSSIYSGYDCVTPIYTQYDQPANGKYKKVKDIFEAAAADLMKAWNNLRQNSEEGDAITAIEAMEKVSWEALGLALPKAPENSEKVLPALTNQPIPQKWIYKGSVDADLPAVAFSFPEPLTQYAGEATEVEGELIFSKENSLDGATGLFTVNTHSVTMGLEDLDHHIHESMLFVDSLAEASFEFIDVKAEKPMAWGDLIPFEVKGNFRLKNIEIEVVAKAQAELTIAEDGETPQLLIYANFHLPELHDTFGLERPGGPASANNQLYFTLNFVMEAPKASN
jgi:hypothetical protein